MRDPARIERILELVRKVWEKKPDYRLGQLLINAMRPKEAHPEIFAFEDSTLEKMLLRMLNDLARGDSNTPPRDSN